MSKFGGIFFAAFKRYFSACICLMYGSKSEYWEGKYEMDLKEHFLHPIFHDGTMDSWVLVFSRGNYLLRPERWE
jgi:hypothetical protein